MKTKLIRTIMVSVFILAVANDATAQWAVIDASNLSQNIIAASEEVTAVSQQIQQYETQLQQYENELQNTAAPVAYIWDQVTQTINQLVAAQDTLTYYINQAGSLQAYVDRYQDLSYYSASACFTSTGCTSSQRQSLSTAQSNSSQAWKASNDALFASIQQQQQSLVTDAQTVTKLQQQASGADGQVKAIQAATQLASAQANQLLQIRAVLVAQQNEMATRAALEADKEAQESASSQMVRQGTYQKSTPKTW